jgi:hypothetical protein
MSKAAQFRQYAEDAMLRAARSNTEKEQMTLIELARFWTQAASAIERGMIVIHSLPEHTTH